MRIAFLIKRKNYYRVLGAVIEEALRREWRVECWHDHAHSRTNWKGHEFPDLEPAFRSGAPVFVPYQGTPELAERFEVEPPDAVISVDAPEPAVAPVTRAPWFWLQFAADLVLDPAAARGIGAATAVGLYSPWWARRLRNNVGEGTPLDAAARRKLATVGMPMLDLAPDIDPDEVRWTYGLPRQRPVVLYLPFPLLSTPPRPSLRGLLRRAPRLARVARGWLGPPWNDRRFVEALRGFCERNGAALVVKSRRKDPSPTYLRRAAAAHFLDEPYHPPVILELLRCAALCVHFYSTAVLEAVACGVPSLCLGPAPSDMGLDALNATLIHHGREGGIYNWSGAAHWRPVAEALDGLGRWGLADFPIELPARKSYVERFLGFDDAKSSARFLDLVAGRVRA